jgi:radical SAM superfamily enzyme YgiQ (UPF0313 family)
MKTCSKTVLLFNPWIYDFAAYDFWAKPIGLLYLGAVLQSVGYSVHLVDCLDRFHPALTGADSPHIGRADATGKFIREEIEKPAVLKHVPRRYCRYGMPPDVVSSLLQSLPQTPDVILVTSIMTYWYPAVRDAVQLLRALFPHAHILLGGVYATLCAEHALEIVQPDELIAGEGEVAVVRRVAELTGGSGKEYHYQTLDDLPFPAFDLYPVLNSVPLLTSRGCPNSCSFCASKSLTDAYRRRSAQNVIAEIEHWHNVAHVSHFAFFDDALLHHSDSFIKPILKGVIDCGLHLRFHTPNGLTPRYMDEELAQLFFNSGVETVRLSFETANPQRQRSMSAKVTNDELRLALEHLENAGYSRGDIGVYVMMGLPGQTVDEFRESALMVHDLGARVFPASFSPIPTTLEWQRAIDLGVWKESDDLLLTNTTLFPIWSQTMGYHFCFESLQWAKELNEKLVKESAFQQGTAQMCLISSGTNDRFPNQTFA